MASNAIAMPIPLESEQLHATVTVQTEKLSQKSASREREPFNPFVLRASNPFVLRASKDFPIDSRPPELANLRFEIVSKGFLIAPADTCPLPIPVTLPYPNHQSS